MLKVRCDRSELTECLGDILGIVPTAPAIEPILLNCHLRTSRGTSGDDESLQGESRLEIEVTDLAMAARIRLERAEVLEDGELALPASRFYAIVREVPEKHVVIESLDDQRGAMVRSNGYEFKVLGHDPREFPEVPAFAEKDSLGVPREKFVEILRRVAVAASRDTARFQLNGVFFEVNGDKLLFTATNGKRLTHDYLRIENPNGISSSAIVPNRVVDVLLKILSQGEAEFRLALGDPDIHVSFGRGELTAKLIQGTYPDYHAAIGLKANVKVTAKRSDFLNAARSAAPIDRQADGDRALPVRGRKGLAQHPDAQCRGVPDRSPHRAPRRADRGALQPDVPHRRTPLPHRGGGAHRVLRCGQAGHGEGRATLQAPRDAARQHTIVKKNGTKYGMAPIQGHPEGMAEEGPRLVARGPAASRGVEARGGGRDRAAHARDRAERRRAPRRGGLVSPPQRAVHLLPGGDPGLLAEPRELPRGTEAPVPGGELRQPRRRDRRGRTGRCGQGRKEGAKRKAYQGMNPTNWTEAEAERTTPELERDEASGAPTVAEAQPDAEGPALVQEGNGYTASNIRVLEGLEAVRKRPDMYIGDTYEAGLLHLVYEVVDNSIDEVQNGHADLVRVTLNADGSCTVIDNGRGIPVDMHEEEGIPAVEVVMTKLHSGGKFDGDNYKVSGGLHGVGVSCVNALAEWMEVEVWREQPRQPHPVRARRTASQLRVLGKTEQRGTKVTFKPDRRHERDGVQRRDALGALSRAART